MLIRSSLRAAAAAMIFGFAILMAVSRRRSGQPAQGKQWTAICDEPRARSRRRGGFGLRGRAGGAAGPTGADLPTACRGGGEDRSRDTPRVLRALVWCDARFPCGDHRHPCPDLACCRHPYPLRLPRRLRWPSNRRSSWRRSLCHAGHCPAGGSRGLHSRRRSRCLCHRLATTRRSSPRARPSSPPSRREEWGRLTNDEERNGPPEPAPESHIFRAGVIPTSVCLTTYNGGPEDFMLTPLDELVEQVAAGTLRVQVGKVFKLDDIVEAHRCMEENKAGGKIVVLT